MVLGLTLKALPVQLGGYRENYYPEIWKDKCIQRDVVENCLHGVGVARAINW